MGYILIYVLFGVVLLAYLALGTAQAFAIAAGLMQRGVGKWPARAVALLLAYLPVVGSAAAVRGAMVGWGWSMGKGLVHFFGPVAVIVATMTLG
jgi:uncharacterized protein (DUF697 family)